MIIVEFVKVMTKSFYILTTNYEEFGYFMYKIRIPTINDEIEDFIKLFNIYNESINLSHSEVLLDFSFCRFLRQNAVAFLGGVIRNLQKNNITVYLNLNILEKKVYTNLEQNGFISHFFDETGPWTGNSIPYLESYNEDGINNYLEEKWLGRGWINISEDLKNAIVGKVYEIFANAYEHSKSEIGVFSCGQHYPSGNELKLTVVDFGVSIPKNVRNFLGDVSLSSYEAIRWALADKNTTRISEDYIGGLGLGVLKDFIEINRGKLEIYSDDGCCVISKNGVQYYSLNTTFLGTAINISLNCDENKYSFKEEQIDDDFFLF
ncbi:ATP-binding protein [Paraliobacillus salinarum]|uniref:ATP-binding protein n=1 Tax=Paraliobacillus salinarum TaxID=1158996 RepID=UPI0015F6EF5F|nr:ATP-binding protein [Paraliobacillus salinarum]